jgi:hypothetical protein
MYLLVTQWPDQNSILFPCGRNRRSNHVAPLSLPRQTLKLSILLLLIVPLLYILRLLTTLLLLFIIGSLKSDRTPPLLTTRTLSHGFSPTARRTPLKK